MKKEIAVILLVISIVLLSACGNNTVSLETLDSSDSLRTTEDSSFVTREDVFVTEGTEEYRGFILDNVLHSEKDGEIHYNLYIPDSYGGTEPYALFFTLPGYGGLYFQGGGENLRTETIAFTAQEYNSKMIVVAPQLEDCVCKSDDCFSGILPFSL